MSVENLSEYREFHSIDEAEQWAQKHYPDIYGDQRLDNSDFEILTYYSGSCYKLYNSVLRLGWEYSEDIMHEAHQLIEILGKYTVPESVVAYRYTHKRDLRWLFFGKRLRPGMRMRSGVRFMFGSGSAALRSRQPGSCCRPHRW